MALWKDQYGREQGTEPATEKQATPRDSGEH